MRRLLSLNSYHYRRGGADVVYLEHDKLFRDHGWEGAFFAMHHPQNLPCDWDRFFVDELQFGHEYGALEKARMATKVIYSIEARRKLASLLDHFRPDVAHAHNLYHHISPSVLPLLKARGIPTVLTAHDLKLVCPSHDMLASGGICERCKGGRFYQTVLQRCVKGSLAVSGLVAVESAIHHFSGIYRRNLDRVLVPSQFYLEKFVEWGWPREHLRLVPNFVDPTAFAPQYEPGGYFLFFGRITATKGVSTLLAAAAQAGVRLVVVGTGDLDDEVRRVAATRPDVQFLGRKSGAELFEVVKGARAIVLPSEWYENAPMSLLEAFALGKPGIGADIGGIPEMIRPDETGWLFPSGDRDALAGVLALVAGMDDAKIAALGRGARALVEERFTPVQYVRNVARVYSEIGVAGCESLLQ
jgi:glycosyltransferase involved in cell wall biosynthesis